MTLTQNSLQPQELRIKMPEAGQYAERSFAGLGFVVSYFSANFINLNKSCPSVFFTSKIGGWREATLKWRGEGLQKPVLP